MSERACASCPDESGLCPEALDGMRCLVVEDHVALAVALSKSLVQLGVGHVDVCADVRDSVDLLHRGSFTLVLLDYQLPDGTAVDVLNSLPTPAPVVMVMTAEAGRSAHQVCMSLGAWSFVRKPVTRHMLSLAVQQAAKCSGAHPVSFRESASASSSDTDGR